MSEYRIDKHYCRMTDADHVVWVTVLSARADIAEAECRAVVAENERDAMTCERDTLERSLEAVKLDYRRASDAYDEAVMRYTTAERTVAELRATNRHLSMTLAASGPSATAPPDWLAPDLRAAGEAMARVREAVRQWRKWEGCYAPGINRLFDAITAALGDTGHAQEHGVSLYRGVVVVWDEDHDRRVLELIDTCAAMNLPLVGIHEREGVVSMVWAGCVPRPYEAGNEVYVASGDYWTVQSSRSVGPEAVSLARIIEDATR